ENLSLVRACVSVLLVTFPLYIYFSVKVRHDYNAEPEKQQLPLRKSQIYLTLFISGVTFSTALVALIYSYLEGRDFTLRFFLKAAIVLVVSGSVFTYYLLDINTPANEFRRISRGAATLASAAVIAG